MCTQQRCVTKYIPSPTEVKSLFPASVDVKRMVVDTRRAIERILSGEDDRVLLICGPCSIHDVGEGIEYAKRLATMAAAVDEHMLIVMRTYFEKPRTTVGWKGLLYDPAVDGSCKIEMGIKTVREFLVRVNSLGVPCAYECLDTMTPAYIADLISWAAIGARTVESQIHRQMVSGLAMPVGFKNSTAGDISVAVDAIVASASSHNIIHMAQTGRVGITTTPGNSNTHIVLRGGKNGPNYQQEHVKRAAGLMEDRGLHAAVVVDCSHGNSGKSHLRQPFVCRDVNDQIAGGSNCIVGLMVESNLIAGRQTIEPGVPLSYGKSITDACVGLATTERLILDIADAVRTRRHRARRAEQMGRVCRDDC